MAPWLGNTLAPAGCPRKVAPAAVAHPDARALPFSEAFEDLTREKQDGDHPRKDAPPSALLVSNTTERIPPQPPQPILATAQAGSGARHSSHPDAGAAGKVLNPVLGAASWAPLNSTPLHATPPVAPPEVLPPPPAPPQPRNYVSPRLSPPGKRPATEVPAIVQTSRARTARTEGPDAPTAVPVGMPSEPSPLSPPLTSQPKAMAAPALAREAPVEAPHPQLAAAAMQPSETQPSETQPGETQAGEAQPAQAQPGEAATGDDSSRPEVRVLAVARVPMPADTIAADPPVPVALTSGGPPPGERRRPQEKVNVAPASTDVVPQGRSGKVRPELAEAPAPGAAEARQPVAPHRVETTVAVSSPHPETTDALAAETPVSTSDVGGDCTPILAFAARLTPADVPHAAPPAAGAKPLQPSLPGNTEPGDTTGVPLRLAANRSAHAEVHAPSRVVASETTPRDTNSSPAPANSDSGIAASGSARGLATPSPTGAAHIASAPQRGPALAPPTGPMRTEVETQPAAGGSVAPARQIQLQVNGGEQRVDVKLTERSGQVLVSVRTPDPQLAGSLRQDLPLLSSRLEQAGFHAEAWHPASTNAEGALRAAAAHSSHTASQDQNPSRQGGQEQPQSSPRQPKPTPAKAAAPSPRKEFAWLLSQLPEPAGMAGRIPEKGYLHDTID